MSSRQRLYATFMSCALALGCSTQLAACGGGGGGTTAPAPSPAPAPAPAPTPTPPPPPPPPAPPPTPEAVLINAPAGSPETRLPCNRGQSSDVECGLRLYQVMVEAFVDADPKADYNVGYGNSHHKGDLLGIIQSLDYIQSLGVNALWLTPVFESKPRPGQDIWADRLDATGYFASDYFQIDPKFGTLAQAKTLVGEAHKRGLYVFFDGVFGHHKGNVLPSPSGKLPAGGNDPVSYPASLDFYKEVATYWIRELKIDGWRLDQAYQVPTSAWADIRAAVQQASQEVSYTNAKGQTVKPLGYMVGEIWKGESDIAREAYGSNASPALNSAFHFPGRYRLLQTLAVEESGKGKLPASTLRDVFSTQAAYPDHAKPNLMLGNHDLVRFGDLLQRGGLAEPASPEYWKRHKAALAFQAAFSGPITLYYGDEIGQEVPNFANRVDNSVCAAQGLCDDHVARSSGLVEGVSTTVGAAPTSLSAAQADLKAYTARLMALRQANPALSHGARIPVHADGTLYLDRKEAPGNRVLFVLNTGSTEANIRLATSTVGSDGGLTDLESNAVTPANAGFYGLSVPALSARFLRY
jgi:glycosidase